MKLNVLITGCSSGFGRLTAETLAMDGHFVFASMRDIAGKNAKPADDLTEFARRKNLFLEVLELEVTDESSVKNAVKSIINTVGHIDVVLNNAGIAAAGLQETFTMEQARKVFEVNTLGPLSVNRAVLPHMRARKSGLLIHISSTLGRFVLPCMGIYCASKFALEALVESYSYELAPLGIDSVIIEPGAFPTGIQKNMDSPLDMQRIKEYGELAGMAEKMFSDLEKTFSGPDAPSPQMIADAVKKIIETPAGQRPLRTVVDALGGGGLIEDLNNYTQNMQKQIMQS